MTILVAGGTGTIGVPLTRALIGAGHDVVATTRSPEKRRLLHDLGATPLVVDALDPGALAEAVAHAAPSVVIHQLTALPKEGPRRARDLEPTNRLRDAGTRNLLAASLAAGARRFVAGSFALLGAVADASPPRSGDRALEAVRSMESQVLGAANRGLVEGIVLRYGFFYGPGTPSTASMLERVHRRRLPVVSGDRGRLPFVHVDDAVAATVASVDRGLSGHVYNVVDDRPASFSQVIAEIAALAGAPRPLAVPAWLVRIVSPYFGRMMSFRTPLSNMAARQDLGWAPRYASYREGLRQTIVPGVSTIGRQVQASAR